MYQQPNFVWRTIMTPGSVEAHPSVLRQMGQSILGRFDLEFLQIMDEVREMTKVSFATKDQQAPAIDSTSRSGLEVGLPVLIEPGDKVLVPAYGRLAYLLGEICGCARTEVIYLEKDQLAPFEQTMIIEAIKEHQLKIAAMIHDETANAQMQPLNQTGTFYRENEVFFVIDMMATYGGVKIKVNNWRISIAITGTQKCVNASPGLPLITYNQRVADYLAGRYQKELGFGVDARNERFIQSNYLDLSQLEKHRGPERLDHHTRATTMIYGLHKELHLLLQEGMENVYARHRRDDRILVGSLRKMGLEIFGKLGIKTPTVISAVTPEGVDSEKVWSLLLDHFKTKIASSFDDLKGKVWRVGNMRCSSREDNVLHLLNAFETVLKYQGYQFGDGSGNTHALAEYLN